MGIAIITGASSGIGREFALQLEKSGEVDGFHLPGKGRMPGEKDYIENEQE